ncbi:hypothetical protein Atai01_03360 [Amycolatopsis taiwanensis]|uniref:Uncharacterized protein n=1 Tax=Amycolatopsis taiwanensis TaxID=342230 RepID=A0A9W6QXB0_9PSEU|nr:hypothetical protein Atai01_03360 [Amycolatopsis taiwanensis]
MRDRASNRAGIVNPYGWWDGLEGTSRWHPAPFFPVRWVGGEFVSLASPRDVLIKA